MQRARAERRLFVGTYTEDTASEGIYVLAFDEDERRLHAVSYTHLWPRWRCVATSWISR